MTQKIDSKLIVFTGPDGIGKTTQANMLVEWMNSTDFKDEYNSLYKVTYIKELNSENHVFNSINKLINSLYKVANTQRIAELIKINRYLLYDYIYTKINKYFDSITVVDRWNICTYCYLKAKDYDEDVCLSYLNDEDTTIPGLTIMLVGIKGANRTTNREDNNNMFEGLGDHFNTKLANVYIDFDESLYNSKVVKINNDDLTKNQTQELIRDVVLEYIKSI